MTPAGMLPASASKIAADEDKGVEDHQADQRQARRQALRAAAPEFHGRGHEVGDPDGEADRFGQHFRAGRRRHEARRRPAPAGPRDHPDGELAAPVETAGAGPGEHRRQRANAGARPPTPAPCSVADAEGEKRRRRSGVGGSWRRPTTGGAAARIWSPGAEQQQSADGGDETAGRHQGQCRRDASSHRSRCRRPASRGRPGKITRTVSARR